MAFEMRSLFEELQLEEFIPQWGGDAPGYKLRFGPIELEISQQVNRFLQQTFMISGICKTSRTIALVEAEVPTEVASREQGLALLAYYLRDHVPNHLKPPWLAQGTVLTGHLPWRKVA